MLLFYKIKLIRSTLQGSYKNGSNAIATIGTPDTVECSSLSLEQNSCWHGACFTQDLSFLVVLQVF